MNPLLHHKPMRLVSEVYLLEPNQQNLAKFLNTIMRPSFIRKSMLIIIIIAISNVLGQMDLKLVPKQRRAASLCLGFFLLALSLFFFQFSVH